VKDWETHLTTIFPEIRLKRYLEMRGADGGPWANICALPALWVGVSKLRATFYVHVERLHGVKPGNGGRMAGCMPPPPTRQWQPMWCRSSSQVGLFYDKGVQAEAAALVSDWTLADMEYMREQVSPPTVLHVCCGSGRGLAAEWVNQPGQTYARSPFTMLGRGRYADHAADAQRCSCYP
jgi:Glutamate-cysteine ligase family 2(GCS2)